MKGATFRSQSDVVAYAVEQFEIETVFQRLYLSADRTLGNTKLFGSTRDTQAITDD